MKVLRIREQKDGGALMDFELSKKDETILRKIAKDRKKKYSNEFVNNIILTAIKNSIDKELKKK